MSVQVRKEWRALRSGWLMAMVLALFPLLQLPQAMTHGSTAARMDLWIPLLFIGCLLMGMETLGHEFHHRTFGLILVQPTARRKVWVHKMTALGWGLGTVTFVFLVCSLWVSWSFYGRPSTTSWVLAVFVAVVAGVGPSLYLSVLLRQPAAVFWLSLLLPLALFGLGGMLLERAGFQEDWVIAACGLVTAVGATAWWMAYRSFVRAEDVQSWGQELQLPGVGRRRSGRTGGAWSSLWWKELRLHQLPAVIVLLMIGLLVAMLVSRSFVSTELMSLNLAVWVFGWILIPLMIGAGAVAEERRMGTLAAQRVLPVSWNSQWWIKVAGAFTASLVLGVGLPALLNWLAWLAFRGEIPDAVLAPWWFWLGSWILGTTLGLYGSSLSRSLLQAFVGIALVIGGALLLFTLLMAFEAGDRRILKLGWTLTGALGVPLLVYLTRSNTEAIAVDRRLLLRNASWVVGMLIGAGVLSAGLFNRAWERVIPWPKAGPALPAVAGVQPGLERGGAFTVVLTPDGRLWGVIIFGSEDGSGDVIATELGEGQTWVQAAARSEHVYGLNSAGTLYEWHSTGYELRSTGVVAKALDPTPTRQIGAEGEWKAISAKGKHAVALRKDGKLWGWGRSYEGQLAAFYDGTQSEPARLSPRTDWKLVTTTWSRTLAADAEGRVWRWGAPRKLSDLTKTRIGSVEPTLIGRGTNWVRLSGFHMGLGEQADGSVWMFEARSDVDGTFQERPPTRIRHPFRAWAWVGRRGWRSCVLSPEGKLWGYSGQWTSDDIAGWINVVEPKRLGPRSDWVGLTVNGLALTADGVVWAWADDRGDAWFAPSERPRPLIALGQ